MLLEEFDKKTPKIEKKQTDSSNNSRQADSRFRTGVENRITKTLEMNESDRKTADRAASDSDRCIEQNYKNTKMNESRSGRQQTEQQQIHADSSQTANSDSRSRFRQTEQTDACRRNHPNNIPGNRTIRY
ncbi:hypothetical protein Tco_0373464 [Tanacetum coccineum]